MARTLIHQEVQRLDYIVIKVWRLVSNFGDVASWIPTLSACEVDGEGVGAVRTVTESGVQFQEKLELLDDKNYVISYRILDPTPFPMVGFRGTLQLENKGLGACCLTWTADAESVDEEAFGTIQQVMVKFIKSSIMGLKEKLENDHISPE